MHTGICTQTHTQMYTDMHRHIQTQTHIKR